jgi:hypothetical protein
MNEERTFLHDISSPLTIVQLNVENALTLLKDGKPEDLDECANILASCMTQATRATNMIRLRREHLIKETEK